MKKREESIREIINCLANGITVSPLSEAIELLVNYFTEYKKENYTETLVVLNEINQEVEGDEMLHMITVTLNLLVTKEIVNAHVRDNPKYPNLEVEEFISFINKLHDHINLELVRIKELDRQSMKVQKYFDEKIDSMDSLFKDQKDDIDEYSREIESRVNGGVTTILGIFAAFIIAAFGGISVYGNTLSSIDGLTFEQTVLMTFLFGLILFNVCFMLIYSVSKISNRNIGVAIDDKYRGLYFENPVYYVRHYIHHNEEISKIKKIKLFTYCTFRNLLVIILKFYFYFMDAFKRFPLLFTFNFLMIIGMFITMQFIHKIGLFYNFFISNELIHRVLNGELFY